MKLEDYDRVYALLMSCTGVGLNDLDDSWESRLVSVFRDNAAGMCYTIQNMRLEAVPWNLIRR